MRTILKAALVASCAASLAGCGGGDSIERDAQAFAGIGEQETVTAAGTEPFWSITITGSKAVYSDPELPSGKAFEIGRFAGNNGLGYSGQLAGEKLILTITPGQCNDGMSERTYPYTATLALAGATLMGCAYTNQQGGAQQSAS